MHPVIANEAERKLDEVYESVKYENNPLVVEALAEYNATITNAPKLKYLML